MGPNHGLKSQYQYHPIFLVSIAIMTAYIDRE